MFNSSIIEEFEAFGSSQNLCILLHGYGSYPGGNVRNNLDEIRQVIINTLQDTDIYFPDFHDETSLCSVHDPQDIVNQVLKEINQHWQKKQESNPSGYQKIYLIGYSLGAILARKIYICACGFGSIKVESPQPWAKKVDRIILLAGVNRGWSINYNLQKFNVIWWKIGVLVGNSIILLTRKKYTPLAFTIRKGASFITELRIQWILMRQKALEFKNKSSFPKSAAIIGSAMTIQLLGTKDDIVSPQDNIDLVTGSDFFYLDVPVSNHFTVLKMLGNNRESPNRKKQFEKALTKQKDELAKISTPIFHDDGFANYQEPTEGSRKKLVKELIFQIHELEKLETPNTLLVTEFKNKIERIKHDLLLEEYRKKITDVIFVIHGIRDEGHWTTRIAQRIKEKNQKANKKRQEEGKQLRYFATETSRYGYFPMLSFALPWKRRAQVAWFMDQYTENLARYPNAEFSFVGHSNGTYLLAQALKQYEYCKFKRVVFAGSVVPKEYDWLQYIENEKEKRVEQVLNYVATDDLVVAIFPNFLNLLQRDIGSAGHDGFEQEDNNNIRNIRYMKGDHGSALNEYNWNMIADFIVSGLVDLKEIQESGIYYPEDQSRGVEFFGRVPWVAWLIIISIAGLIGYFIYWLQLAVWLTTLFYVFYVVIILVILILL